MIGPLRQTMTKGLSSFATWAYEAVDALGRCWFLLFATLSVGIIAKAMVAVRHS